MYYWLYIIESNEDFEKLWNTVISEEDLYLGRYIIIQGSLRKKNGRVFGKEGEILAAITLMTFDKEIIKKLINKGKIEMVLISEINELAPEELDVDKNISNMIKKEILDFAKPSEFLEYLEDNKYKDF